VRANRPALRVGLWLGLVAGLASPLAAVAAPEQGYEDPAARARVTQLGNGLTVLTLEDHTTPTASLQVWVEAGSGDEARWSGLAHLFEHMMFRGSKNLPPEAHAKILGARGAVVNAFTSKDVTVYFENLPAEHLPLAIALEGERVANLDISTESLTSERQVVIEERRLRTEDDPQGRAFETLLALAFQAHPYRIPTIGWRSDLEKVGVDAAEAFYRDYYAANNITVVVAGDFDTEEVLARVEEAFGGLRAAEEIPRNPTEEPPQLGERRATIRLPVRAPQVALAWHAPPAGDEDAEALDVVSQILSRGRTSRLYRRLVYEEAAALGASAGYWELSRAGIFYAETSVRPGVPAERAEALLREEIDRLRSEPVSAEELERAKRALEVGLVRGLRTSHAVGMRLGRDWVTFGRIRPLEERLAAIRAVTADDVQRVADVWLEPDEISVVYVVPEEETPEPASSGPPVEAAR
jgi:zinc protease